MRTNHTEKTIQFFFILFCSTLLFGVFLLISDFNKNNATQYLSTSGVSSNVSKTENDDSQNATAASDFASVEKIVETQNQSDSAQNYSVADSEDKIAGSSFWDEFNHQVSESIAQNAEQLSSEDNDQDENQLSFGDVPQDLLDESNRADETTVEESDEIDFFEGFSNQDSNKTDSDFLELSPFSQDVSLSDPNENEFPLNEGLVFNDVPQIDAIESNEQIESETVLNGGSNDLLQIDAIESNESIENETVLDGEPNDVPQIDAIESNEQIESETVLDGEPNDVPQIDAIESNESIENETVLGGEPNDVPQIDAIESNESIENEIVLDGEPNDVPQIDAIESNEQIESEPVLDGEPNDFPQIDAIESNKSIESDPVLDGEQNDVLQIDAIESNEQTESEPILDGDSNDLLQIDAIESNESIENETVLDEEPNDVPQIDAIESNEQIESEPALDGEPNDLLQTETLQTPIISTQEIASDAASETIETPEIYSEQPSESSQFAAIPEENVLEISNEVWVVSSERLGDIRQNSLQSLCLWKLSDENCWEPSSVEAFVEGDRPEFSTIVYVHGNYLTQENHSIQDAAYLKSRLEEIQRNETNPKPFRLVVWKWTSERILARIRKDCQLKASLADQNGFYLADLLAALKPQGNVALVGFSFGARTIGASLELLAGGTVWGIDHFEETEAEPSPLAIKIILVGAACDYCDFQQGGRFSNGLELLNGFLNVFNPADRALKFYPKLYECKGPSALGVSPVNLYGLPENLQTTTVSMNSSNLGPEHGFVHSMSGVPSDILKDFAF